MRINYTKNNDNLETAFNLKSIVKVARKEETDHVGKTTSQENLPPEKSTTFHKIQGSVHTR